MADAILHSQLDTDSVPENGRFAAFRKALSPSHDVYRRDGDSRSFRACLDAWMLGGLAITTGRQMASRIVRTPERIATDGLDHFTFMYLREGLVFGNAGHAISFAAGQIGILDLTQPFDVLTSDNRNIGVRIPREMLRESGIPLPDLHGLVLEGTQAQLIGDHFVSLVEHLPTIPAQDANTVTRATAGLIATCLQDLPARRLNTTQDTRSAKIYERVMQYVDSNLKSTSLSPAKLCGALKISRSNLYRAFQSRGGVSRFIVMRRLEAVHSLLIDPEEQRSISELAYQFGFVSVTHFSTAFRRKFGITPREARLERTRGPARQPAVAEKRSTRLAYRKWLQSLGPNGVR